MGISILASRRTKQAVYVQVRLSDAASGCTLDAQAALGDGSPLPARAQKGSVEGQWLVSLPTLSVTQVLTLTARDADGAAVEELASKINALTTRLPGPADLVRRGVRPLPEPPSEQRGLGVWEIHVERLVSTTDEQDICQGWARVVCAHGEVPDGPVEVQALDARGVSIAADWTCLADELSAPQGHPHHAMRYLEFSLRIPQAPTLVLWVKAAPGGHVPSGFVCLSPRVTAELRGAWRELSTSAAEDEAYDVWYAQRQRTSDIELAMQRASVHGRGVLFSLVCVVRDATPQALRDTVDSVLEQSYGDFELLLVHAASDNRKLAPVLRELELLDARVRNVPLAADFGSAAATSAGIDAAMGDFSCLLNEGDLLAPDALWCLAMTVEANPRCDMLYTDEDCLDKDRHVRPSLKPGWDPDLLLGTSYLGNLLVLRTSLLDDMEPMDRAFDGVQGFRLALYAARRAREICHVPRVLYHRCTWQTTPTQGAAAAACELLALRQHLGEVGEGITARMSPRVPRGFELTYPLPDEPPLVSVVVLNRDNTSSLDRCLKSLHAHTAYENYEVIVVENGSQDPTTFSYYAQAEEADERVHTVFLQQDADFDEVRLVNFGVSRTKGELLLLLHNDVELIDDGWMERMVSLCLREGTAAVGLRLVRPDGTVESCGESLSPEGRVLLDQYRLAHDVIEPARALLHGVAMASGACLMVRRSAFEQVGGLSSAFSREGGVADLCLRLWGEGLRVVVDPQVSAIHHRSLAATGARPLTTSELRLIGRLWESWPFGDDACDPALGPNVDALSPYRTLTV